MPYAIKSAGVGLGTVILFVVAIINDYSLILMIKVGSLSNTNTYQVTIYTNVAKNISGLNIM